MKEHKKTAQEGMHPLLKENVRHSTWIIGINLLFFLSEAGFSLYRDQPLSRLVSNNHIIVYLVGVFIPYFTVNTVYLFKTLGKPYCRSQIELIVVKIVGLIVGVIVSSLIIEYISKMLDVVDDDYMTLGGYTFSTTATNIITNIVIGLLIGVPTFLLDANKIESKKALQQKQMELDKLEQLKVQSELAALQAKINPHFLYNSLNSIVSLIHENPGKAEQMVLSLSDLFRYSVNSKNDNYATLEQELEMVSTYLDIELVRFEDQLEFEMKIGEGIEKCLVPKFLIQPLIENAIKHGTSKITHGVIKLHITKENENLHITLYDNGPNFPEDIDAGYGIKSTVDKLDLLYKNAYLFKLNNTPEKHLKIELKNTLNYV